MFQHLGNGKRKVLSLHGQVAGTTKVGIIWEYVSKAQVVKNSPERPPKAHALASI